MSASTTRAPAWISQPLAALAASLAVVLLFVVALGFVFLPREARRLIATDYVSITHCLVAAEDQPGLALFWTVPQAGQHGWRHHLAAHELDGSQRLLNFPGLDLRPSSMARGKDEHQSLVGCWDGSIYSVDLLRLDKKPFPVVKQTDGGVVALGYSHAAECLVSQSAFGFFGWSLANGSARWRLSGINPYCFALRPDEPTAICGTTGGELIEIDLHTGREIRKLAHYSAPVAAIALSSSGRQLAVWTQDGALLLLDPATAELSWHADGGTAWHRACGRFAAFSPSGKLLVTAGPNDGKTLAVWNVETGQQLAIIRGHRNVIQGASFRADGILCSWGADGTIRSWDVRKYVATEVASLTHPQWPG